MNFSNLFLAYIGIILLSISLLVSVNMKALYAVETPAKREALLTSELSRLSVPGANFRGNESAKITLVEFGDYQCTFCKRFHANVLGMIIHDFVNTGKVRFLFKDFPINDLPPSNSSTVASMASYCAADQGKYWEYHDQLYENSRGENTGWINQNSLIDFAKGAGIGNITEFSECALSQKYSSLIKKNYDLAQSLALTATPSFVLLAEGKDPLVIVGSQPFHIFDYLIINKMS
jgi:protein-disulfide isomerase